jgi:hypothetical protein
MKPHAELQKQNSDQIVDLLMHKTTKDELKKLVEMASAASGVTVSRAAFDPGDELCPIFKFPFPFPPKFADFLGQVVAQRGHIKVFPLGIINPEEILVQARLAAGQ